MASSDKKSDERQILQSVLDTASQSLKVKLNDSVNVSFVGGEQNVEISATDGDTIAIADANSGNLATVNASGRLLVEASGSSTVSGSVTIPPSTDFSPKTWTVTTTPQQLTFPDLAQVTSITIRALGSNSEDVKIKKSAVAVNFYLLSPGESVGLPVSDGADVFVVRDNATGTCQVTTIAMN